MISENSQFEVENGHKITLHEEFYKYNQKPHTKGAIGRVGLASQGLGSEHDFLEVERGVGTLVILKELGIKIDNGFGAVMGVVDRRI